MSDSLKLIQNKKFEFIDIEKESGFVSKKPSCTPKTQTIGLSVSACKELKLETFSHCNISSISPLEETSRLYLRFNNNESSKTNFKLLKPIDGSIRSGAVISGTTILCRKVPRYNALVNKPLRDRKTELGLCSETGLMYIPLGPEFENKLMDINNAPEDKAIYKILYNGNILNIGETNNLSRRLKEKKAQGLKMHEVYYSPMNTYSDDERKNWETIHIEKYKKQYGSLPPENRQSGREIN